MKAPQAAAPPQTWSAPCRHLLTYFCRLLTHHWHIRARVGAHGHEIKYLLRTPSISLCCQMQRLFFSTYLFFCSVKCHSITRRVLYTKCRRDSEGRHFKLGTAERRLHVNVLSDAFAAQQAGLRKNASLTADSTDGNLLELKKKTKTCSTAENAAPCTEAVKRAGTYLLHAQKKKCIAEISFRILLASWLTAKNENVCLS